MEKDIIHFGTDKGKIRLLWTYRGKRYGLSTGIPDSAAGRRVKSEAGCLG